MGSRSKVAPPMAQPGDRHRLRLLFDSSTPESGAQPSLHLEFYASKGDRPAGGIFARHDPAIPCPHAHSSGGDARVPQPLRRPLFGRLRRRRPPRRRRREWGKIPTSASSLHPVAGSAEMAASTMRVWMSARRNSASSSLTATARADCMIESW